MLRAVDEWGEPGGVIVTGLAGYLGRLQAAELALQQAAACDPANPEPWVWLLLVGWAGGLAEPELEARFTAARARGAEHFAAYAVRLRTLSPGTAPGPAAAFVHGATANAPPGSVLHALVAQRHIERWAWRVYAEGPEAAAAVFDEPGVCGELTAAFRRSGAGETADTAAASLFAMAFYLAGDPEQAREAFLAMGCRVPAYPWRYLRRSMREFLDTGYVVDRVRTELGLGPLPA